MNRGEIWTLQDDGYASKARPVLVVQSDTAADVDSVVLCLFTSFSSEHISTRVKVDPTEENGLRQVSFVMTDKIITVRAEELGTHVGTLSSKLMQQVSGCLAKILEITAADLSS